MVRLFVAAMTRARPWWMSVGEKGRVILWESRGKSGEKVGLTA